MSAITRQLVEEFLYREVRLLDERRFEDWLALFCENGRYEVPSPDLPSDADASSTLFLIADSIEALGFRVERSLALDNHADYPASNTARMISNVEILSELNGIAEVCCVFQTVQASSRETRTFYGRHFYKFEDRAGGFRILLKKTLISQPNLHPQGRLSIIL